MKKRLGRFVSLLLCGALMWGITVNAAPVQGTDNAAVTSQEDAIPEALLKTDDYSIFLEQHEDSARGQGEIEFKLDESAGNGFMQVQDYTEGISEGYYTDSESVTQWTGNIPQEGLYAVKIDYVAETERGSAIVRDILINGKTQHSGCDGIEFSRTYVDNEDEIGKRDQKGNQIRPSQLEIQMLQSVYLKNAQGLYSDPYLYYFEKGDNTITLQGKSEPMTIGKMTVCPIPELPDYKEYLSSMPQGELAGQEPVIIEAENAAYKSSPVLYGKYDRTSPATSPYEDGRQVLNMVGGANWSVAGQYLAWNFQVPESGYYKIALKAKQNFNRDFKTSRAVYIDGEIPCEELKALEVTFQSNWQMLELGNEEGAYTFYLEKGNHEIRIEASLGAIAGQTKKVQDILQQLNALYTDIMVVTGAEPDKMRDYRLGTLMPELTGEMSRLAGELEEISEWMLAYNGKGGQSLAALNVSAKQLRKMSKDADIIPKQMSFFKTNNGALANWLLKSREQPLELDYIALVSDDNTQLPKPNAGFVQQAGFEITNFLRSFSSDYQTMGTTQENTEGGNSITVWIPTGRDQAQVLRKLIDRTFTPETGIEVNLQLVTAGSLLPATVADIGPDVALNMGDTEPVNYAIRDAVIDLNRFPDYEEVAKRFLPERMVPLTFDGKVYALPETQNFNVMFYRTDILEDLGVEVPQTWTDVVSVIPHLLKHNMNFALPVSVPKADLIEAGTSAYFTLLFQNGGELYKEDGAASDIDSEKGMDAFRMWTNLYVNYALPQEYDFLTRFRTGESPIIVGNFANFNTLMVSAPEIKGLWSFSIIPGTLQEDGTIDRSTPLSGTDCFIMKNSKNYDASWEFMKWWTSAETQVGFGKEMESVLGESARYATANIEGFSQIAWDNEFYKVLTEQMEWGRGIEQVPGGYFTGRHINNAFRKVVLSKEDIRETLLDYVYVINQELIGKRKEFGLAVQE